MNNIYNPESISKPNRNYLSFILICISLIVFGLALGLRNYNREIVSDDLLYRFILDDHSLGNNVYTTEIQTLQDAIESQKAQYFHSNGRFIVHVLVQMFAGPWGITAYSIFLGLLGISILVLFSQYTLSKPQIYNPFLWALTLITYLYLFQSNSRLWYSFAGGMNYLYPMLPVLTFMLTFSRLKGNIGGGGDNYWLKLILLALLGFITGWSQECYSLPLSGGIFLYCIFRYKKLNAATIALAISLWIGTAILVFAPGNFERLEGGKGPILMFINGIELLYGTKLFWLMVISLIFMRIKSKNALKEFVKDNSLDFTILAISIGFGMIANTLPQSFNGISFYSAIILFKVLNHVLWERYNNTLYQSLAVILLIPVCIHQFRIVKYCEVTKAITHEFIAEYVASKDGVMVTPTVTLPCDIKPYVKDIFTTGVVEWTMHTISRVYGINKAPIRLLYNRDYQAYSDKNAFLKSEHTTFNGEYHVGDKYIWFDDPSFEKGDSLQVKCIPVIAEKGLIGMAIRLKRKLSNQENEIHQISIPADSTMIIGLNGLTGVKYRGYNISETTIKDISTIKQKHQVK
ncbi:MAG: hypothetical protein J1E84_05075 [Muribaculaceae bacterium]|nr:hypothetical protein [Muribaculaceae bacterium]